jgi:hypothetical protein
MAKKIKKETLKSKKEIPEIKEIKKEKNKRYLKISLVGAIIFSLILIAIAFCAGIAVIKLKNKVESAVTKLTTKNVFSPTKVDKPELDFYVMSFCPYGNQMEQTLKPVFDLLGNKADLKPRYIFEKINGDLATYCKTQYTIPYDPNKCADYVAQSQGQLKDVADCKQQIATMVAQAAVQEKTCNDQSSYLKIGDNLYSSLHGRMEANEDVREICAYNLNDNKKSVWDFILNVNNNCTAQNADTCWEDQAKKAGLDTNKITECFNKDAGSLIEKEIADTTKYNVQGSPTLMIGDKVFPPEIAADSTDQNIKVGNNVFSLNQVRTSDVIKQAICSAFKKAPKECKTVIKDATADASQPAVAAAANTGAGCAAK